MPPPLNRLKWPVLLGIEHATPLNRLKLPVPLGIKHGLYMQSIIVYVGSILKPSKLSFFDYSSKLPLTVPGKYFDFYERN